MDNSRMKDWVNGQPIPESQPVAELCARLRRRADSTKWHDDHLLWREAADEIERLRALIPGERTSVIRQQPMYSLPCCAKEKRNMDGGCDNCGDPCL